MEGGASGGMLGVSGVIGAWCFDGVCSIEPLGVSMLVDKRPEAKLMLRTLQGVVSSELVPFFFFLFMRLRLSWSKWQNLQSWPLVQRPFG
mmetsp:Transcript_69922/g.182025  ORF Transcript_69922/g.182025 Transcript_69922/m.182025 type:complete len:90 (+) Transcript_69922:869-1138(+)